MSQPKRIPAPTRIPPLGQIKQIPVPSYYQGHPERIRDFLDGFQAAYELALAIQNGEVPTNS